MKRVAIVLAVFLVAASYAVFATEGRSTVSVSSIVMAQGEVNPCIMVGVGTTHLSSQAAPDSDTTVITDIDLSQDGYVSFALVTSQEVFLNSTSSLIMGISITAEGFNRYDVDYKGITDGSSNDDAFIIQRNAVPVNPAPVILVPMLGGKDQNVSVTSKGAGNEVSVQFNAGKTRSDCVLGTFDISWNGQSPLEAGVYKAKVNVTYSLP